MVASATHEGLYLSAWIKAADVLTLWEVASEIVPHLRVEMSHEQVPEFDRCSKVQRSLVLRVCLESLLRALCWLTSQAFRALFSLPHMDPL